MKTFYLFALSCCIIIGTQAQPQIVGGRVLNDQEMPLEGAAVSLLQAGVVIEAGWTNEQGRFLLGPVDAGDYWLKVAATGYEADTLMVTVTDNPVFFRQISLAKKRYDLETVQIEEEVAPVMQQGDTTQFNAGSFKTNPDANSEDLVEKMPGIVVENGQVQAQGEQVRQVLVDGRPFFGNDPSAALRNLPAEVVDKIQVFDQQSEQAQLTGFDDGETTKTINIVTKVNMRNGTFGKGYGGYGLGTDSDDQYQAGASINRFNGPQRLSVLGQSNDINQQNFSSDDLLGVVSASGSGRRRRGFGGGGRGGQGGGGAGGRGGRGGGSANDFLVGQQDGISQTHAFGLNYSDEWGKKLEFTGSYFFNQSDNATFQNLNRVFFIDRDSGQVYREESLSESRNRNHRANLRLNYEFSRQTSLFFQPRLTLQENNGSESLTGETARGDFVLNTSDNFFASELKATDYSQNLMLRHRFKKRGRTLSLRVRGGYQSNQGQSELLSGLNYFTEPISLDTLDQRADLQGNSWNLSANAMYTEPLSRVGMMQFFYSFSPQWSESDKETFDFEESTQAYTACDTLLSNVFRSRYWAHSVGMGLMFRQGRKFMLMTRVSAQWSELDNEQVFPQAGQLNPRFFNVLPMLMLRYGASRQKNLRLMYRTSTNPPSISQLQEVVDNSNPLQLSTGNPALDQSYQHQVSLRYNATNTEKSSVFLFFLNGTFTQNYIGSSTLIVQRDTFIPLSGEALFLQPGTQLTRPENLDGFWRVNTFLTLGRPLGFLKSNLNINLSANYSRTPGLINGMRNEANSGTLGIGVVLSSNISEKVDFTLSSRTNLSQVTNTLQPNLNTEYLNQVSKVKLNLIFGQGLVFRSELNHQLYSGLSENFNQNFWLWNMGLAKKFFAQDRGELQLSVFDLMRQNTSIQRSVTETYVEDLQTRVLQRYLMLTFTYQIRSFKEGR